jgi:hypothetical protein
VPSDERRRFNDGAGGFFGMERTSKLESCEEMGVGFYSSQPLHLKLLACSLIAK